MRHPTLSAINKFLQSEILFMEEPHFIIRRSQDCSKAEISQFEKLVVEGGQVNTDGLDKKILDCKLLGFCYVNKELASIAAIKIKPTDQIREIFKKTQTAKINNMPKLELGYCFTNHHHRGKKFSSTLNDRILEAVKGESVFATTGNPIMVHYFESRGFDLIGKPYKGNFSPMIYLFVKYS